MSGIDVSKEQKINQENVCAFCMNSVVQSFNHYQKQILRLQEQKLKLQMELDITRDEKKILQKKLAQLNTK
jgi:hypothetical protein